MLERADLVAFKPQPPDFYVTHVTSAAKNPRGATKRDFDAGAVVLPPTFACRRRFGWVLELFDASRSKRPSRGACCRF